MIVRSAARVRVICLRLREVFKNVMNAMGRRGDEKQQKSGRQQNAAAHAVLERRYVDEARHFHHAPSLAQEFTVGKQISSADGPAERFTATCAKSMIV
jgi:hypothetical protein